MADIQKKTPDYQGTVVIVTYNRPHLALHLVKSIRNIHPHEIQIIVVDQQYTSGIKKEDAKKYNFELYITDEVSMTAARNKGIEKAVSPLIIFFDDDVDIEKNTVQSHLYAYTDSKIGGVAGRVINDNDTIPEDKEVDTGITNSLLTKFLMQFWSTKKQSVDFVYGCNMSFRKELLNKINGFDEELLPPLSAFEEIDLALRIKKQGYEITFVPEALVYHHKVPQGGARVEKAARVKQYYDSIGYIIHRHVKFPLSLVSLLIYSVRAARKNASYLLHLYKGYLRYNSK